MGDTTPSYYGYVNRQVDSQVNWAKIGQSVADKLNEEAKSRQEKKDVIDERSGQLGNTLENTPQGQNPELNEWTHGFIGDAQEYRLMQDRMLRNGQLDLRDYTRSRQNLTDGTKQFVQVVKSLNENYDAKLLRDQQDESSHQELWEMDRLEGFSSFRNVGAYIDPMTGKVSIAKLALDEDGNPTGEISSEPGDVMSMNMLLKRLGRKIDRFDVDGNLSGVTQSMGEVVRVIKANGIDTWSDIRQEDAYVNSLDKRINALLTDPTDTASILTDYVGGFDFTENPAEQDEDTILLRPTGPGGALVADFESTDVGKKQKEAAKGRLKEVAEGMLESKEVARRDQAPNASIIAMGKTEQTEVEDLGLIMQLRTGDAQSKQAAANALAQRNKDIKTAKVNGNMLTVTVIDENGRTKQLNPIDMTELSDDEWVRSGAGIFYPDRSFGPGAYSGAVSAGGGDFVPGDFDSDFTPTKTPTFRPFAPGPDGAVALTQVKDLGLGNKDSRATNISTVLQNYFNGELQGTGMDVNVSISSSGSNVTATVKYKDANGDVKELPPITKTVAHKTKEENARTDAEAVMMDIHEEVTRAIRNVAGTSQDNFWPNQ